mgnify:CR=1 FL=1
MASRFATRGRCVPYGNINAAIKRQQKARKGLYAPIFKRIIFIIRIFIEVKDQVHSSFEFETKMWKVYYTVYLNHSQTIKPPKIPKNETHYKVYISALL